MCLFSSSSPFGKIDSKWAKKRRKVGESLAIAWVHHEWILPSGSCFFALNYNIFSGIMIYTYIYILIIFWNK